VPALSDRLDLLAARGDWLRTRGKWAMRGALCLASLGTFLWWPDPAGPDIFQPYGLVPSQLAQHLQNAGVRIDQNSSGFLKAGGPLGFLGLMIWAFLALQMLVSRYVRSGPARFMIYSSSPVFLIVVTAILNASFSSNESFQTVYRGFVVDHPGAPPVPSNWSNSPPVTPYLLRLEALPPALADQGRYVLAQQAYFDSDPAGGARHLRALTGAWHPDRAIDRGRIGIIDQWAAAHGEEAGAVAREIGGGGPWSTLRRAGALLLWICAGLVFVAGIILDIAGTGRRKRFEAMTKRIADVGDEPAVPAAPTGFGRRTRPLVTG